MYDDDDVFNYSIDIDDTSDLSDLGDSDSSDISEEEPTALANSGTFDYSSDFDSLRESISYQSDSASDFYAHNVDLLSGIFIVLCAFLAIYIFRKVFDFFD